MLFTLAPVAAGIVAFIGIATALFAATIAIAATDIKRVLAYSTISQLGYMMFAVGIGAYAAGIFHLVTHAFFKALLFLGAGSVIHALSGEQDMRKMGNLKTVLPTTHWTMLVGTLAIAGIFPLAGFWSKDEILASAIKAGGINVLWWLVGAVTAFVTAFYMFRLYFLTFHGDSRLDPEVAAHVHESPDTMRTPLIFLAVLSIVGGLLGFPPENGVLHHILEPVFAPAVELAGGHHHFSFVDVILMVISLALAVGGGFLAYRAYVQDPQLPQRWARQWQTTYTLLVHKYFVDEAYAKAIIVPLYRFALGLWQVFDVAIIDRIVNGVAGFVRLDGELVSRIQTGYVRTYALWVVIGALCVLWFIV
jgi:NADH-quinone oxidoreductase subunit L